MAAGLPVEGKAAGAPRIADHARRDVPTCSPGEKATTVRARAQSAGWDVAVAVGDTGVVLGLLRVRADDHDAASGDAATVAASMDSAPVTVRPHVGPAELPESARKEDVFLVTTSDGVLIGLVRTSDLSAERARRPEAR